MSTYIFLKGGPTNWGYVLILIIVTILVGSGIFGYSRYVFEEITSLSQFLETGKFPPKTANWKTYRNEEYGFEIKYPTGWIFSEENLNPKYTLWMTSFYPKDLGAFAIQLEVPFRIDVDDRNTFSIGTRDWESLTVNSRELFLSCSEKAGKTVGCEILGFSTDALIYVILTKDDPRQDEIIYKMLSTFRFSE